MAIKRITTNLIEDGSIGTIDIANNAITAAKITDGNITTAKLADLNVTAGKLAGTLDLTGKTITVATATTGDSDTSPASTAFVQQEIAALVDSSPSSLNTLNELAAALGDDASFSTTVTNSIATKSPINNPEFTGTVKAANTITIGTDPGGDAYNTTSPLMIGSTTNAYINIKAGTGHAGGLLVGDSDDDFVGGFIYSNSTNDLTLFSNNNERMRIDSNGGVVIGDTSIPQYTNLKVYEEHFGGMVNIGHSNTGGTFPKVSAIGMGSDGVNFGHTTNNGTVNLSGSAQIAAIQTASTGAVTDMAFYTTTGGSVSERMRIDSSGHVGIGMTAAPVGSDTVLALYNSATPRIKLHNNTTGSASGDGGEINMSGSDFIVENREAGNLRLFNNGAERMRIEADGDAAFAANATGAALIKGVSGDQTDRDTGGYPQFTFVGNEGTGMRRPITNVLAFDTSGAERMRIDSSGTLLIGTTNGSGAGLEISKIHGVRSTVTNNVAALFDRLSSDGDIALFRKDGSTVGSIGANSNDMYIASIGTYSCGLMFEGSSGARDIRPCSSTGALLDGSVDLGDSTARFNDLYLDGGVHLGGTGSANKLDDYEEGTWTPDLRNGTTSLSTQTWHYGPTAVYTKIGDLVFIHLSGKLSAVGGTSSGELRIFGLPFSGKPSGGYQEYRMNFFLGNQPNTADSYQGFAFVRNNGSDFGTRLLQGGDNIFTSNRLDNDTFFTIFGCYKTNS
jgi:hypothetical protein